MFKTFYEWMTYHPANTDLPILKVLGIIIPAWIALAIMFFMAGYIFSYNHTRKAIIKLCIASFFAAPYIMISVCWMICFAGENILVYYFPCFPLITLFVLLKIHKHMSKREKNKNEKEAEYQTALILARSSCGALFIFLIIDLFINFKGHAYYMWYGVLVGCFIISSLYVIISRKKVNNKKQYYEMLKKYEQLVREKTDGYIIDDEEYNNVKKIILHYIERSIKHINSRLICKAYSLSGKKYCIGLKEEILHKQLLKFDLHKLDNLCKKIDKNEIIYAEDYDGTYISWWGIKL